MCGIYGLWSSSQAFPAEALGAVLAHRGPDDAGRWSAETCHGTVHLGHRRLSIRDLSPQGHQPLATPDGRFVLTYNGEIYNDLELRAELEALGVVFSSTCDTEVLLHGFATWGVGVLERICGMFAFAIWDGDEERLVLARDATGIKPLYVLPLADGEMAFASEVRAFGALPGVDLTIDDDAIDEILGAGFVWSGDRTSMRGVRSVPAGSWLEVRDGRIGEPVRWLRLPRPASGAALDLDRDLDRQADRLYELLDEVTAQHLRSDVPVGLLLSGGLDSSVLAALAARHATAQGRSLTTVTMGFEPSARDERRYARAVVEHLEERGLSIDAHEVVVRPADAAATLFDQAHHLDDFFGDSGTIPAFAAFAACRRLGLKVVLVGEGADEVFGGYPQFRTLTERADRAPDAWVRHLAYRSYTRRRWGADRRLFASLWKELLRGHGWFDAIRRFETTVQLPSSLNRKVDRASMASSVEARVPYQDRRVLDFVFRLPRAAFLEPGADGRRGKLLLRHMARRHDLVPASILERPKRGTPVPWSWLRDGSDFARRARETLLAPGGWTERLGLERPIRELLDDDTDGAGSGWSLRRRVARRLDRHANRGWLAMQLLMLEAWSRALQRRTIDDGSTATESTGSREIST